MGPPDTGRLYLGGEVANAPGARVDTLAGEVEAGVEEGEGVGGQ